jgi:hypothetical protein
VRRGAASSFATVAPARTPGLHGNNFYANCRFSHTNNDDPIVYPRQRGRSHPHTYFGNSSTDANSTLASLRDADTTCKPSADKAAYWIPTLYRANREIRPSTAQFYFSPPAHVRLFLELHVNFPDCWDGKRLDSPDHHSHMAYSRAYVCPASHPVKVPLIRLNVRYPITGGQGIYLSSGGALTAHADFFNAWDEHFLTRLVNVCFHDRPCNPEAMSR